MSHDDDRIASEGLLRVEFNAAVNEAGRKTAEANHRARMLKAGRTWGVRNGAAQAMIEKGEIPTIGGFQKGDA